jgi:hypothetical protein
VLPPGSDGLCESAGSGLNMTAIVAVHDADL